MVWRIRAYLRRSEGQILRKVRRRRLVDRCRSALIADRDAVPKALWDDGWRSAAFVSPPDAGALRIGGSSGV